MVCTGRTSRRSCWFWTKMMRDLFTGHSRKVFNVLSGATRRPDPGISNGPLSLNIPTNPPQGAKRSDCRYSVSSHRFSLFSFSVRSSPLPGGQVLFQFHGFASVMHAQLIFFLFLYLLRYTTFGRSLSSFIAFFAPWSAG
jgi:hypothetical protein